MCSVEHIDCFCQNSHLASLNEPVMSHRAGGGVAVRRFLVRWVQCKWMYGPWKAQEADPLSGAGVDTSFTQGLQHTQSTAPPPRLTLTPTLLVYPSLNESIVWQVKVVQQIFVSLKVSVVCWISADRLKEKCQRDGEKNLKTQRSKKSLEGRRQ